MPLLAIPRIRAIIAEGVVEFAILMRRGMRLGGGRVRGAVMRGMATMGTTRMHASRLATGCLAGVCLGSEGLVVVMPQSARFHCLGLSMMLETMMPGAMIFAPAMAGHGRRGRVAVPLTAKTLVGSGSSGTMMRFAVMMMGGRSRRRRRLVRGMVPRHRRSYRHHGKNRGENHLHGHLHTHCNQFRLTRFPRIQSPEASLRAIRLGPLLADCRLRTSPARPQRQGGYVENPGPRRS